MTQPRRQIEREARRDARNLFWHARREFVSSRWRLELDPHVRHDPEDGRRILGQNFPDTRRIVLHAHDGREGSMESTLVHELLHTILSGDTKAAEDKVGQAERSVFSRLLPSEVRWLTKTILGAKIVLGYRDPTK